MEDLKERTLSCMLTVLKLSPRTVYGQTSAYMKAILDYCSKHGEKYYNLVLLNNFGSSRKVRETNREEPNEHKEETVISVAISKALGNFNLVIESLKFTC